jgi:TatD DNase family protein
MLFDTHVNLHGEAFAADLDEVLTRARAAGVRRFVAICDKLASAPAVRAIAAANADIWCSVGVHPHHAKDHQDLDVEGLVAEASDARVCAIGETGLDQHYGYSDIAQQERSLCVHIEAARALDLPLVIHAREADDLAGDILEREFARAPFRFLMHCYTGGARLAARALDLGAIFSVSGIYSFKAAGDVREVMRAIPLERIILETDCPYLAPVPHRGRRNEPAFLLDVCRAFAADRSLSFEEAAQMTTRTALAFFNRVTP